MKIKDQLNRSIIYAVMLLAFLAIGCLLASCALSVQWYSDRTWEVHQGHTYDEGLEMACPYCYDAKELLSW